MKATHMLSALSVLVLVIFVNAADEEQKEKILDPETLEYAKGSVCGYCEYCKGFDHTFCELCESDCPCETSASKPNCKMCKYCKFCYLCSGICDTVCQPGGILDTVSSAIVGALPIHNKDEIDKDLDSVQDWISKEKRDEL